MDGVPQGLNDRRVSLVCNNQVPVSQLSLQGACPAPAFHRVLLEKRTDHVPKATAVIIAISVAG